MKILYFITGILIFLAGISLISLRFSIIVRKKETEDSIHILLSFLKINHEIIIPYGDMIYDLDHELNNSNSDQEKKDSASFVEKFKNNYKLYHKFLKLVYPPFKKMAKRLKIKKLEWNTSLGSSDAGETGLLSGMLWIVKGQLISFLQNIFKCEDIKINITPKFNHRIFKTSLDCIIQIKIGYIIITLIKIAYLLLLKGGELSEQSSN